MKTYTNQKVLVFGLGLSGRSAAKFLQKRGACVSGFDDKNREDAPFEIYTDLEKLSLQSFDLIVYSPGIRKEHPLFKKAHALSIPLVGEIELAADALKGFVIGVTGTNGKSTTTALIAHLLNFAGRPALACGNIGKPLTEAIDELQDKIAVIELSSYQIEDLSLSILDIGLFLNLTADHLDRYHTMENYAQAKFKMQKLMKPGGVFFYEKELEVLWSELIDLNLSRPFNTKDLDAHQNVQGAYAVLKEMGISKETFLDGMKSFKGLEHRLEYVTEIKKRAFYNDSKATNIESVASALSSFNTPLILIMGGQDKGLDFSALLPYFKEKVKKVFVIGECKHKLKAAFSNAVDVHLCETLNEATHLAYKESLPGDTVLLSPCCSSFDQFKNFEERGRVFKTIVNQLEGVQS